MSQTTIKQLAKALNRGYSTTCSKMQLLLKHGLAVEVQPAFKNNKTPTDAIFELKVPLQVLIDEPYVVNIAKKYGIVFEKPTKAQGMSDLSKFCANPFNLGGQQRG